jgi:hypothetical protein
MNHFSLETGPGGGARSPAFDGIAAANPGAPREWRLSFVDRALARAARAKALSWNSDRVIIAHGEWRSSQGHVFLKRALAWLGPEDAGA